jgi:type IV pilus assembly protein PilV
VVTFGLLSLAGFVAKANASGVEANQRARALALLEDMAERIRSNQANADSYVTASALGASVQSCSTLSGAAYDACDWNNLLNGQNDALSSAATQLLTFRGCVTKPSSGTKQYTVTVAWGSAIPGVAPSDSCGMGAFGDDTQRRIVRTLVRIG